MAKDNFSIQSKAYAAFRPILPREVYDFVMQQANAFDLAWDVGTGNGQAAVELSRVFKQVMATDISDNQLANALQLPNIIYRNEPAERTLLDKHSVDLVMIVQAIHWFRFDAFYAEVSRVAKPGAVIAALSYSMFRAANETVDEIIQHFYKNSAPYWDAERKYIDEQYQTIPFPFAEIAAPEFFIRHEWNIEQMIGYMRTWSANQHYLKQHGVELVDERFKEALIKYWPDQESIPVRFPVHIRIGKV